MYTCTKYHLKLNIFLVLSKKSEINQTCTEGSLTEWLSKPFMSKSHNSILYNVQEIQKLKSLLILLR